MILRNLKLQGFKKFKDHPLALGKGFNVFCGPNEIGKTTIHQAILTVLYGLGAKVAGLLKKDVESWNESGFCKISLEYQVGLYYYQLERDIKNNNVVLKRFDPQEKKYIVYNEDAQNIQKFIANQLGIESPVVFNNTVSVSQSELASATDDLELVSQNIEKIFTGREALSPEEILDYLHKIRKQLKKQRNEKPGKIDLLSQDLLKTNQELSAAEQMEKEVKALEKESEKLEQKIPQHKNKLEQMQSLLEKWKSKQKLDKRLRELNKQQILLQQRLASYEKAQEMHQQAKEELQGYQGILDHRAEIDNFIYHYKRLHEIDVQLEMMLGQKVEINKIERFQQTIFLKRFLNIGISILLLLNVAVVFYALFLNNQNLLLFSIVSGFVLILFGVGVQFLPGKKVVLSSFNQMALEREEIQKKIQQILSLWGISKAQDLALVLTDLEKMKDTEDKLGKSEIQIKTILGSENIFQMQEDQKNLSLEAIEIKQALAKFQGYEPNLEQIHTWEKQQQNLENELPVIQRQLHQIQGRMQELHKQKVGLLEIASRKEFLEKAIEDLEFQHNAVLVAIENFQEVIDQYQMVYIPQLAEKASRYFYSITNGRYKKVDLSRWPNISVFLGGNLGFTNPFDLQKQIKQYSMGYNLIAAVGVTNIKKVPIQSLSHGTLDQLFLALRIATSELLSKENKLPLFFDDPFTHFDESRLEQALKILLRLAKEHQILYFTHNKNVLEIIENIDPNGKEVTLINLVG